MKQVNVKKLILPNIPYVFIALLATKVSEAVRLAPGSDASAKLLNIMTGLNTAFHSLVPSFHPIDLCVGVAAAIAIRLAVYIKGKNAKKFRKNLEYGSARWGTAEDIKPYVDPAFENNIILTQTERLTMNSRPKDPKTARNKNVLIVGGSGSGKTRFWLKPNLLQCTSKTYPTSFVVTDPKGDIVVSCGHALQKNGYQIKILNSLNFKKSMHYNPFAYIHSEKDILKLVTTLIANTKGEGKAGDDFWVKAETLLYTALIGYIHYEAPMEEQNFSTLIEFINAMEVREDDEDFKNPVDLMFEELKKRKPDHFAVRQYAKFKLSAGKTAKSILISCGARLAPFDIQELRELTAYDELQLDTLGDRKTALFIIMSDTDDTFNFLISMCYTQLFNLLCEKADDVYGGRLPVHVRCLIDECANIGQIRALRHPPGDQPQPGRQFQRPHGLSPFRWFCPFVPGMVQDAYGIPYASCRVVQLLSLVGFLVHQSQQLVHVDAVYHAGLLHGLTAGRGAAQAMHADGQENGRSLRCDVQNITDDGVLRNIDHWNDPPVLKNEH